jgi:Xaa-Pro aminopeptidase
MTKATPYPRGFPDSEFEIRTGRAQTLMTEKGISALLLTTEPEIRYFSGFLTQFWQSPTRPWFLVVPAVGKPVAVIPEIGRQCMARTWITDIRTWDSPHPDDDGIRLLSETLKEAIAGKGRIGLPMGRETHLRLPLSEFTKLNDALGGHGFEDATDIITTLRELKSDLEIAKIGHICQIASEAFAALPNILQTGMPASEIFCRFKIKLIECGADDVPYIAVGVGQGGYQDIISPPSDIPTEPGDILILDTGSIRDGYFCDFDRNFAFHHADDEAKRVNEVLYAATQAGIDAARPGASMADLHRAMAHTMENDGYALGDVGRMGHGLGMQMTEWPSIAPFDPAILKPGMIMTIEPGLTYGDGLTMVHEENILIQDGPPMMLSRRAAPDLQII